MNPISNRSATEIAILSLLFFAVAAAAILFATSGFGTAITPDSLAYLTAGEHLLEGKGMTLANGRPLILWPPLLPAILALAGLLGIDPVAASRFLNAILLALSIMLAFRLQYQAFSSKLFAILSTLFLLLSASLIRVHEFLLSEPLFVFCSTAFLYCSYFYLKDHSRRHFWLLALFAAAAALTRYAGVYLIAAGASLLLLDSQLRLRSRLIVIARFALVSGAPLALWLVRNLLISGTLTGTRSTTEEQLLPFLGDVARHLANFAAGTSTASRLLFLLMILALLLGVYLGRSNISANIRRIARQDSFILLPAALLIATYIAIFAIASLTAAIDPPSVRMLIPIYIPLLVALFYIIERTLTIIRGSRAVPIAATLVLVLFSSILVLRAGATAAEVSTSRSYGVGGFTTKRWIESPTLAYLDSTTPRARLVSNAPEAITFHTELPAQLSAIRHGFLAPSTTERDNIEALAQLVSMTSLPVYLVWFEEVDRPNLYALNDLLTLFPHEVVNEFEDGKIYRLLSPADMQGKSLW